MPENDFIEFSGQFKYPQNVRSRSTLGAPLPFMLVFVAVGSFVTPSSKLP